MWNASLKARVTAYESQGIRASKGDPYKKLTALPQGNPEVAQYLAHSLHAVLNRLDKALHAARVKRDETPGCPRFKGCNYQMRAFDIPTPTIK